MSHFENPDYDGYETAGQYTDGEYGGGTHMAESSADWGGGAYEQQYAGQSQFDRASDVGSGATEDGDEDADYIVKDGDDGRYPEKAQLEEAGYRYEAALRSCGHGKMQWMIFAALSIGLAAESIEQFVIGFILPSTQKDLCLTEERSAWLGSIAYLGLCFGALIWGGVSDKVGRRHCLLVCLSISGFFSILSAFTQGFGSFLFCRLGSSIGIGGAVPAAFSYYAEVLPREKRAEHLSWLCLSWVFGGVYAAAMAWEIIPNTGWGFAYGSEYQFHAWRVFVVVCALPSVISATALTFLPESPRWLLRSGNPREALSTLQLIHDTNYAARNESDHKLVADMSAEPQPIDPGLTEISRSTDSFAQRIGVRLVTAVDEILTGTKFIAEKYRQETIYLAICWFCLSFAGFGVQTSVPNQIRSLRNLNYETHRKFSADKSYSNIYINTTVENQNFRNMSFMDVVWQPSGGQDSEQSLKIRHVKFESCTFKRNKFVNVQTPNTRFESCNFEQTVFYDTDLKSTDDQKFQSCVFDENTKVDESQECSPQDDDVAGDAAYWEYIVALLGSMAALPGLVACGFLMGRIGRINMLCGGLFTGMIFALFLPLAQSAEAALLAILCLFSGLLVPSWSAVHVLTVESFPTDRRSTALGIFIAVSRGGALLGSLYVVNMPLWAGSFLGAAALLAGGIFAIRIQDTGNRPLL